MVLRLFYDLRSQPSRALYIILKSSKTPFEPVELDLTAGDHLKPEYAKVNRFKRVPAIEHDDFSLTEGIAIIQYLKQHNMISDMFLPTDSKRFARVNEFLNWHHIDLRWPCSSYFISSVMIPMLTGHPTPPEKLQNLKKKMSSALDKMENLWLSEDAPFIAGDTLTAADVFGCCEVEHMRMLGYDPGAERPKLKAWLQRVRQQLAPHYAEAHAFVDETAASHQSKL